MFFVVKTLNGIVYINCFNGLYKCSDGFRLSLGKFGNNRKCLKEF